MNETVQAEPHKLDEVMLAMDVVDTLRHEADMLAHDLAAPDREQKLIARLREIYDAQGIEVPDEILREGVKALDSHRFAYNPQKPSFLAKAYINRGKWGKPLLVLLGIFGMVWAVNFAAFEMPKNAQASKIEKALNVGIPKALEAGKKDGLAIAKTAAIKQRIEALYAGGMAAAKAGNYEDATEYKDSLTSLNANLGQSYDLRIVSRPRELSGVIRGADDNPDISNFYLIVEGIGASGKPISVLIISEENQKPTRVKKWGVRVPKSEFDKVAADKRDDQIIQNSVIGRKKLGYIKPDYDIKTLGGLIVEWDR